MTARFSSRLPWNAGQNRLSEVLSAHREAGRELLDLTESNPTAAGVAYPKDRILEALADPRNLKYRPSAPGLLEARRAVSEYYQGSPGPERIFVTASTSEAYSWLFKLLCDAGDEVLVPRPSYPLFEFLAALECVRPVEYPLVCHGEWTVDLAALESAITGRTRAIVIVNPNNPTGSFLKLAEYERLAALGIPLISDEVFSDYAFGPDAARVGSVAHCDLVLAFAMSGLSKLCGLPQMKLGWIAVSGPRAARRDAVERLELIADTYLSAGTPVQNAAPALLSLGIRDAISERTRTNLATLRASAGAGSHCRVLPVEGGWYATLQIPNTRTEEEWVLRFLECDGVLVQPGYFYDFPFEAYLVLSLLTPPEVFSEGTARLLQRVDRES